MHPETGEHAVPFAKWQTPLVTRLQIFVPVFLKSSFVHANQNPGHYHQKFASPRKISKGQVDGPRLSGMASCPYRYRVNRHCYRFALFLSGNWLLFSKAPRCGRGMKPRFTSKRVTASTADFGDEGL